MNSLRPAAIAGIDITSVRAMTIAQSSPRMTTVFLTVENGHIVLFSAIFSRWRCALSVDRLECRRDAVRARDHQFGLASALSRGDPDHAQCIDE